VLTPFCFKQLEIRYGIRNCASQSTHCPLAAASRARRSLFEAANKNINHSAGCFWQL
jgi:hypothetical protein